jgi:hypothetical protein
MPDDLFTDPDPVVSRLTAAGYRLVEGDLRDGVRWWYLPGNPYKMPEPWVVWWQDYWESFKHEHESR